MKRKVIISVIVFILLLLSVICVSSYAQAFSREARGTNWNAVCYPNENCPMECQRDYCMQPNPQCQNNSHRRNCDTRQRCHGRMCNR